MKTFEPAIVTNFDMYGTSSVPAYEHLKFLDNRNTFALKAEVKVKMKPYDVFNYLKQFVSTECKFNFITRAFYIMDSDVLIVVDYDTFGTRENSSGLYTIKLVSSDYQKIADIKNNVEVHFKPYTVNSIVWAIMAPNGEIINKEMDISQKYNEAHIEFYPWLQEPSLSDYYERYLNSEEIVLLLAGTPGTGKTTFIKNFLIEKKLNAIITYDEKLMKDDSFFLDFITGDKDVLIIEDADTMIYDREKENNTIMSKILNVSDGIIKNVDKKIIFSTNLTDLDRVDAALIRPGRCFGVLDFRRLTRDEATEVLKVKNITKELSVDKKFFTLAEILSNTDRDQHINKRKVGF